MRKFGYVFIGTALAALLSGPALAQSAKSTIGMSGETLVVATEGSSHPLTPLSTKIHVPQDKELIFDLSLECGLFTRTLVKSKGGQKNTTTAEASVRVNVLYKPEDAGEDAWQYAYPGGENEGIVYCSRVQELSAKFQGIFQEGDPEQMLLVVEDNNGDGDEGFIISLGSCDVEDVCEEITVVGTCLIQGESGTVYLDVNCLTEEEVELVLDTMSANAFNFVAPNLTSGTYDVKVVADIDTCHEGFDLEGICLDDPDTVESTATIGRASLDVDERRFIKNETIMP